MISARALDRCASVSPKGARSSFCATAKRLVVEADVGLTVDEVVEAFTADVEEERSVVID